jgi:hypothetical protein
MRAWEALLTTVGPQRADQSQPKELGALTKQRQIADISGLGGQGLPEQFNGDQPQQYGTRQFPRALTKHVQNLISTALGYAGIVQPRNRFQTIPYSELPDVPLGKGDVTKVLDILDQIHTRSPVAAIALAHIMASCRSDYTGHSMQKRFTFLLGIGPLTTASFSAQQYRDTAPQMDSRKAEATAQLSVAELQVLRWLQGGSIRTSEVISMLQFAASEFHQLDCTKREGSSRTLLALIYLAQWQHLWHEQKTYERRRGYSEQDPQLGITLAKFTTAFRQAVVLVGTGYGDTTIVDMVRSVDSHIVEQTLSSTGSREGRHTVRAGATADTR